MSKSCVHWIPVTTGLPAQNDVSVLVVLRAPDNTKLFDLEERWMCFGTFEPGCGWSGDWMDYLGDNFIVTHWSPRPEFPEDNE